MGGGSAAVGVDAGGATLRARRRDAGTVAVALGTPALGSAATDSEADGVPQAASTTERDDQGRSDAGAAFGGIVADIGVVAPNARRIG